MFYSTRGWFRDFTRFSAFVVFFNALVESGYGQGLSGLPEGVAAGSGQVASTGAPFTNKISSPRSFPPLPNAGSTFRRSQEFRAAPARTGQPNPSLVNQLQQAVHQVATAPMAANGNLLPRAGAGIATGPARQPLSANRGQKPADAVLMARLKTKFAQPRLQVGTSADDPTDPYIVNQAAALHNDPQQMFAFVRDQIGYQAYSGSLRGARGTLWSKAGNALDRASLLVALLRASGFTAQYVQGTLSTAQAQTLILAMFQGQYRVLGCPPAGSALADPANDPNLQALAGDHYWVQYSSATAGPFTNADTAFPTAQLGQTFGTALNTSTSVPFSEEIFVTISENAEIFSPASAALAGNGISTSTVLSQDFLTTDLIGKPVSIGQFVNSVNLGSVLSSSTNTYSPYLIVGGDPANPSGDQVIRGTDFQEVVTNFPLGSQILTGLFAQIIITSAGTSQTFNQTLLDRIGFAARQGGTSPMNVAAGTGPALSQYDMATFNVLSASQDESIIRTWGTVNDSMVAQLKTMAAQLPADPNAALTPAQTDVQQQAATLAQQLAVNTQRALTATYAEASDNVTTHFATLWQVEAYLSSPRILVASSRVTNPGNGVTDVKTAFNLLRDDVNIVLPPGQTSTAATAYRIDRGIAEIDIEGKLLTQFTASQTTPTNVLFDVAVGGLDIISAAISQGIGTALITSGNLAALNGLTLSADAKARILQAVSAGSLVLTPNRAVTINGTARIAWLEIQPDGTLIDTQEDGNHQAISEYAALRGIQAAQQAAERGVTNFFVGFFTGWIAGQITFLIGYSISGLKFTPINKPGGLAQLASLIIQMIIDQLLESAAAVVLTDPAIYAGFQAGLTASSYFWTTISLFDPPLPPALVGGMPAPAAHPGATAGVALQINPDTIFTLPVGGAQVPTIFDALITNTGPNADTFNVMFSNLPAGFTLASSLPAVQIPAGAQAEIGVCAAPLGTLPGPGTSTSFTTVVTSASNPAITSSSSTNFTVPAIAAVTLTATPQSLITTAAKSVPVQLQIQGSGNVATTATLTLAADPNLIVSGLQSPVTVSAGQTITQNLTVTPGASAPLGTALNAVITAAFGSANPQQTSVTVFSATAEAAQALTAANTAPTATAAGRTDIANTLSGLGGAITALVGGCSATTLGAFQNYGNNLLTQLTLTNGSSFFSNIFPNGIPTLLQEIQNTTCSGYSAAITDLNTAVTNLGSLLSSSAAGAGAPSNYNASNAVVQVRPLTATAGPATNAQFQVQVTNVGPVADTFFVYGATDYSTIANLPSLYAAVGTQPVILPGQTFTGTLLLPVPPNTAPGSIPILVIAGGQNFAGQGQASATINVVANGLTVAVSNPVVNVNSTAQVTVTNTGSVSDTIVLSLSGPGALVSVLGANSVTLPAGASQNVNISVGNPSFASYGNSTLEVTGTSQGNTAVTATLNMSIAVPYALGVTARFQPSSQNAPAVFPLNVRNIGSVEDSYTATITATTGSIQANLMNLDGTSTQQIPQFILPGLAAGQLYINASGKAPGSVTVTVTSLTDPTVTATATANICQNCPQAPIADAGAPQSVAPGQNATLDGSASYDPNTPPLALTYSWTLVSAPSGSAVTSASIAGANSAKASFTPDVTGAYLFQLTVSNGTFSASANVTITATGGTGPPTGGGSLPPVAVAGKNRNVANGKYFLLDGSASYDPGANRLTYQWSVQSAPGGSIAALSSSDVPAPAFRPDVAGAYMLQLIVNNGGLSSAPSTVTITSVAAGNIAPNANAGNSLNALVGTAVTLDGSASYDPDNGPKPVTYSWRFTQVPAGSAVAGALTASGATATFTPDVAGAYTVTLTVSDGAATGTDTIVVTAAGPNAAPNANPGKPRRILPNAAVTLDGSGSNDPDKDALTYQWRFVSGTLSDVFIQNVTSAKASFTPAAAGQYVVRLDVSDGPGGSFQEVPILVGASCDGNGDGLVSQIDLDLIGSLIGAAVPASDPLDANGDGIINAADLAACALQVRAATTLTLTSSPNPATRGQTITFTATLTTSQAGTPSGTIQFLDGAVVLATVAVSNGQAVFSTSNFIGDTHTIIAKYSGDATFHAAQDSLTQTIGLPVAVSLVMNLASSANPAVLGQSVTFTASFLVTGGTPTGTVQFFDGLTLLGTSPVTGRQAVFSTSALPTGSHAIIAKYTGDKTFPAAQASFGQVISPRDSAVTITASAPTIAQGQSIVFTAHVGTRGGVAPTGQVLFQDNGLPAGTAQLASGTATLTLNTLPVGTHTITAVYQGDSNWGASHATVTVTVTLPALRLTNAANNLSSTFAPDEIVSTFNITGLTGDTAATLPLTASLGGARVTVTDSAGAARAAFLYGAFASTGQVNFVIPSGAAPGKATVTVTSLAGNQTAQFTIAKVAPGLFTANQNGSGVPVGQIVLVHADGSQTVENLATLSGSTFVATLIKLASTTDQVFLQLYGTGIRHAAKVTATIGGARPGQPATAKSPVGSRLGQCRHYRRWSTGKRRHSPHSVTAVTGFPQDPLGPHDNRPVHQFAFGRHRRAPRSGGRLHHPLSPGDVLGRGPEAGVHVRDLLGMDAELAPEAQPDGTHGGGAQPLRVVDLRVDAVHRRRDPGQP
jgi:hypothetical protein